MFLNCKLLDLTAIDIISIVHIDNIWGKIANKILRCGRPGGGVGQRFGTPSDAGGGGQKREIF